VQAVVVSLCWPAFFLCHKSKDAQVNAVLISSLELSSMSENDDTARVRNRAISYEKVRSGSFADVAIDPVARGMAFDFLRNKEFVLQGLGCALLQAVGFTIPGVQEEIFDVEGYSPKSCSWTGFTFIMSGVCMGMCLGRLLPTHNRPDVAYKLILVLFWGCTVALCSLQLVFWYGEGLGTVGRFWTYMPLMALVGGCSLGFLNVHLPVACAMAEPVSESLSGGLVELLGQLLSSWLTQWSTGRQFWVCALASFAAAVCVSIAPPSIHTSEEVHQWQHDQ